jgi:hypothetical protein
MVGLLRRIESVLVNAALREGDGGEGGTRAILRSAACPDIAEAESR